MAGEVFDSAVASCLVEESDGGGGGIDGCVLVSDRAFRGGSVDGGPRMLAKLIGLLARSVLCPRLVKFS